MNEKQIIQAKEISKGAFEHTDMDKMKKVVMRGIKPVYACDTFFYLHDKKETERTITYIWKSFQVGSINTYSSSNWDENDIYMGFQSIYGWTKKEIKEKLLSLIGENY